MISHWIAAHFLLIYGTCFGVTWVGRFIYTIIEDEPSFLGSMVVAIFWPFFWAWYGVIAVFSTSLFVLEIFDEIWGDIIHRSMKKPKWRQRNWLEKEKQEWKRWSRL